MIAFRARQWGAADWTRVLILAPDEDPSDLVGPDTAEQLEQSISSMLAISALHVQFLNENGEWEDL